MDCRDWVLKTNDLPTCTHLTHMHKLILFPSIQEENGRTAGGAGQGPEVLPGPDQQAAARGGESQTGDNDNNNNNNNNNDNWHFALSGEPRALKILVCTN